MLRKLRIKFVCIMMAIVTVMLCVMMGFVIGFTWRDMERECAEAMQSASMDPGFLIDRFETEPSLPYMIIFQDSRGTLRVRGTMYLDRFDEEQLRSFLRLAEEAGTGEIEEYNLRFQRFSTPMGERFVFVDVLSQKMVMGSLVRVCTAVGAISLLIFWAVSILLARWAVKPVEQAWQEQRQFVADASHELKTPLTVIMTNADLLQNGAEDEASRQRFVSSIVSMSHQMRALVEGLLELARVDNGAVRTGFAQLDFSELVSDSLLLFEALFFERGLQMEGDVEPGINLKGSAQHLRQVIEILLDNAMKYSAPGGKVSLTLRRHGGHCCLSVASPGAAISAEDLKKIFQRFYRIDKARCRDGSYGLGLSIAQQIVTEHGGKIWAESSGGVNTFHIQLPV